MARLFWVWAAVVTCICAWAGTALADDACALDDSSGFQGLRRSDSVGRGVVALTFDDGPQPVPTRQLLDLLDEHDYRATFFVVGQWVRADTYHLIQRMAASGHEIGTHTYSHDEQLTRRGWGIDYIEGQYELSHVLVELALLATSPKDFDRAYRRVFEHAPGVPLTPLQVRREWHHIQRNHAALLAEHGYPASERVYHMLFARPPGGITYEGRWPQAMRDEHEAALRRLGLLNVLWHGISGDTVRGRIGDVGFLLENLRFHSRRGGILLIHDRMRHDALAQALSRMAQDPKIQVTTLQLLVQSKYACSTTALYRSLHPAEVVASE
jgi:peptidoglycan/xylan/chitin deacetylase (PgdA/CDA1 family)